MAGIGSPRGLPSEPKQISSRLLNMKFMQRAAASDKAKPSSAPQTQTPAGEHPSKRRRTGDHISSNRDSTATTPTSINPSSFKDRFAEPISFSPGSELPSQNLKSYAGEHYETEWVLDLQLPDVNGHHNQDQDSDSSTSSYDIWSPSLSSGVQTYGAFKNNPKTSVKPASVSKSARRNDTRKRSATDADLSSLSSDSDSEASDSASNSESNTYAASRTNQARHKANHFQSRSSGIAPILGRDHHQLTDQSDYLKFDAPESGHPSHSTSRERSSNQNSKSKGKGKGKNKGGDHPGKRGRISIGGGDGNERNRNTGAGEAGGGGRKKKRKTM